MYAEERRKVSIITTTNSNNKKDAELRNCIKTTTKSHPRKWVTKHVHQDHYDTAATCTTVETACLSEISDRSD